MINTSSRNKSCLLNHDTSEGIKNVSSVDVASERKIAVAEIS